MALVCDSPSFIFVHVYKCAGMSVREWLQKNFKTYEVCQSHATFQDVKDYYIKNNKLAKFKRAFKFTFIRNPFDWTVSLYFYIKTNPTHINYKQVGKFTFPQFCQWLNSSVRKNLKTPNGAYYTLSQFLCDRESNLVPDFIGRVETFNQDIISLQHRLKVPDACPHINITGERQKGYQQYFDPVTTKLIFDLFEMDCRNFDYDFA